MKNAYVTEIEAKITDAIVAAVQDKTRWEKTWVSYRKNTPTSGTTGKAYRGINAMYLAMVAATMDNPSRYWVTPKTAMSLGGNIKGLKCEKVILAKPVSKRSENADGEQEERTFFLMRVSNVLNVNDVVWPNGKPAKFADEDAIVADTPRAELDARWTLFQESTGAMFIEGEPMYIPSRDVVSLPKIAAFTRPIEYWTTMAHELAHWTADESRLDRDVSQYGRCQKARASEELVAECTAAIIACRMGDETTLSNHGSYLASWLKAFDTDRAEQVGKALTAAWKAADYLWASYTEACQIEAEQAA